ncbi:hypothetical protein QE250_09985 [Chromatiaceae bacterium AAb-1]|nr:hypothetical protein [Chromatiaceae bacterium AAb-1]
MMMSMDFGVPASSMAFSSTLMEKLLRNDYAIHGKSWSELRRESKEQKQMLKLMQTNLDVFTQMYDQIRHPDFPASIMSESFENILEDLSVKMMGTIGFVDNIRRHTELSGNVSRLDFFNQLCEKLSELHNLIVDIREYTMELRSELEAPVTGGEASLECLFAKLDS